MKKNFNTLLVACIWTVASSAQTWTCDEYPDFSPYVTYITQNSITYYLSNNPDAILPPADSIWVLGTENQDTPVMVVHAKEGESIDISSLERGVYMLSIQLGDCVSGSVFFKRNDPIEEGIIKVPLAIPSASKYIRNGRLLIEREGKIYDATGAEVR